MLRVLPRYIVYMRSLKESILSTSKVGKYDEWNTFKRESAHPKRKDELKNIIKKAIELKGLKVDLNWIDTSAIDDMGSLFVNSAFNGDISKWDVSNVKNMNYMFMGSKFDGDISKWDVSHVTDMYAMFERSGFDGDISKWDVSNVVTMAYMFWGAKFNGDISEWDVSNAVNMTAMFRQAWNFRGDLSKWDVRSLKAEYNMFAECPLSKNAPAWYKG